MHFKGMAHLNNAFHHPKTSTLKSVYHCVTQQICLQLAQEGRVWFWEVGHGKHSSRTPWVGNKLACYCSHLVHKVDDEWWAFIEVLKPCESMAGWEAGKDREAINVGGHLFQVCHGVGVHSKHFIFIGPSTIIPLHCLQISQINVELLTSGWFGWLG